MAVSVNATGTKTFASGVTTKDYTGITIASGSNIALIVTLNFSAAVTGITATWDQGGTNQVMTLLVSAVRPGTNDQVAAIFGLRNPLPGALTLRVSWTTSSPDVFIAAVAFNGVDQTNDVAAFPHTASGNTRNTLTVTSASGNYIVCVESSGVSQGTSTGTQIFEDHTSGSVINAMAQYDVGAASVVIGNNGTVSGSNEIMAATDIGASGGGATNPILEDLAHTPQMQSVMAM